jgi:4-amino-4-deoxy-L-arabinose transferase-like glycosyltransferase
MTTAAVRTPAVLGILSTAVMIFAFTRRFLSSYGAAAAAIAFLTFGQVLQLGRLAESEGVFVGVTTAAILGWHMGYRSGRPAWQTWLWTYAWTAAAALTKGPQGAVYVCAAIGLYLLLCRDWRYLFSFGHAVGLGLFTLLFGGWFVGCTLHEDLATARGTVFAMVNMRLANRGSLPLHMLEYPWHVFAALLPWSPLLFRYGWPGFRTELGSARDGVVFCATAIVATFPSVWLIYGALSRHYFSMYPCFAVLVGVVLEKSFAADSKTSLAAGWRWFCRAMMLVAVGGAAVVVASPWINTEWARRILQPPAFAACFASIVFASAVVVMWSLRHRPDLRDRIGIRFAGFMAIVAVIGATYVGISISTVAGMANDHVQAVADAKRRLPPDVKLYSFGPLEHVFTYDFREPISQLAWPESADEIPPEVEYFAYTPWMRASYDLPCPWDKVAVVSCERNDKPPTDRCVIIGRLRRAHSVSEKLHDLR